MRRSTPDAGPKSAQIESLQTTRIAALCGIVVAGWIVLVALRPGESGRSESVPTAEADRPAQATSIDVSESPSAGRSADGARAATADFHAADVDPIGRELDSFFADILNARDPSYRRALLEAFAEFLASEEAGRAVDYMAVITSLNDRISHGDAYTFASIFSDKLAARDPRAATVWAETLSGSLKEVAYQAIARHWLQSDPRALAAWASTIGDPTQRGVVIRSMGHGLAYSDPAGVGPAWAASLAQSGDGERFSDVVVRLWAKEDPAAALQWVEGLGNPDAQAAGMVAYAASAAEFDPAAAAAWVAQIPREDVRTRAAQEIVSRWAPSDPSAAAAWLSRHRQQPGLVDSTASTVAAAWLQSDRKSAEAWMNQIGMNPETRNYLVGLHADPPGRRP